MRLTKQIRFVLFLMIGFCSCIQLTAQQGLSLDSYLNQKDSITYNSRYDFYEVPPLRLALLTYWGQRGVALDGINKSYVSLIEQVTKAKIQGDKQQIIYQRKSLQDSLTISGLNTTVIDCNKKYNEEREEKVEVQTELKTERNKKNIWATVAIIEGVAIVGTLVAAVLIK